MFVTLVFSLMYMYWAKIPHAPFGHKEVRGLLVARGMGGFFGGKTRTKDTFIDHCPVANQRCSLRLLL